MKKSKNDVTRARRLIRKAAKDLGRELTEAMCGDLLADNFNDWPLDYIHHILNEINPWMGSGGMSQVLMPLPKKQTHRELMYDPQHSTRRFKRFMRMTTSGHHVEEAWNMGQAAVEQDVPKRWRTNPYRPGGHRWKSYEDGRQAALRDIEEVRTYNRWNRNRD